MIELCHVKSTEHVVTVLIILQSIEVSLFTMLRQSSTEVHSSLAMIHNNV